MASKFVSFTSGTQTVDGAKGQNNRMERGGSVSSNPVWKPGGAQSPHQRMDDTKYASQTGGMGEIHVRQTPVNQHGKTGKVEPADHQPHLGGHNAG